jgi:hypothetical protein
LGATSHEDVEARHDTRIQEARGRGGEWTEDYQLVEMVRPHNELADVVVEVLRRPAAMCLEAL